eukprot:3557456-Rhodomonas_salina.1
MGIDPPIVAIHGHSRAEHHGNTLQSTNAIWARALPEYIGVRRALAQHSFKFPLEDTHPTTPLPPTRQGPLA